MVKICDINNYPSENEEKYKEHFDKFKFPLHIFQKHAIEGIVEGHHVLICAPTGTGKTLPGEFSIQHFVSQRKKVIYTCPIKSLSNEKFHSFSKKYEHISIGLITGDIKTNPDASILIMTTEILLNKLYQLKSVPNGLKTSTSFDMDILTELGCVVFDEVHFIGDKNRGHIWEQTLMMLPRHIQIVGLSATLDNPERFAQWIENRDLSENNTVSCNKKNVYLTKKYIRAVPLIHYSFITATGIGKIFKDKSLQEEIKRSIDKPFVIQDGNNVFNDQNFSTMNKMLNLFDKNDVRVKRQQVLNKVAEYLVENEMLPALCYVFSRKQLEKCAEEMTTNLLEFDSKVPYTIDYECDQIIRKLPNYKEYLLLPEYINTVKLLRKGIGIHHAGLMSVLREMTEILFSKGYIKILFCTETMSVGINLPVKTCVFTDIYKHDGSSMRLLQAHEYTQAAGRSGRLGLDTVGHVIHLNNLFRDTSATAYKTMMNGKPQTLTSKFKISYNLLLNLIDIGDNNLVGFAKKSMVIDDLNGELRQVSLEIDKCTQEVDRLNSCIETMRTPKDVVEQYNKLQSNKENYANKKRKEMEKEIQKIKDGYKYVDQDLITLNKISQKMTQLDELTQRHKGLSNYLDNDVNKVLHVLTRDGFLINSSECISSESENKREQLENKRLDSVGLDLLDEEITDESFVVEPVVDKLQLSIIGKMASGLREVHCLVFARLLEDETITNLSVIQLIALFSCFTNISVQEGVQDFTPRTDDDDLKQVIYTVSKMYSEYEERESMLRINTGADYMIHYDLLNYVEDWTECKTVEDCRNVLSRLSEEKEIFLGEFVKALLKINNISCEMEQIAEQMGNIEFLSKLKQIPELTLKYVVTNQSLYV
jgi:superfamily II RNA helicase